jgi:hypothetical protein
MSTLKRKCPTKFHSANGMRLHCRTFHRILEVKPAKCSCHLTDVGGRTARENACRLAGCAHFFADVSDQGYDAIWSPGHDRRSLHFCQELPSWFSNTVNFVITRRASSKGPNWWYMVMTS